MIVRSVFLRAAAALVTAVMLLGVGICDHAAYDVEDPQSCRLHFTVLSDVHIEGNNYTRYKVFAKSLQDVQKNASGTDAVVFLGDSTMNGQFIENLLFHGAVRSILRDRTVLPVMGNHDVGNGNGDYDKLQNRWYAFTQAFFGRQLTHPYYYDVIDGYYFIVLGMESQRVHEMVMREEQFRWLEEVLAKAADSGKPAFIFSHFPMDYAENEDGNETDRLTKMLAQYNREHDLFCFVGHTHMPLYLYWSFHTDDGFAETYLPRLTELSGDGDNTPYDQTGIGLEVELYDGEIVIRARDFYRGVWRYDTIKDTLCEVRYPLRDAA